MSLEGATRRLVHLWSQTLGPVQRVFFPRSPPEHPCPPPAPLEYANILGSISEDPVLISELSRLAASEDSSPSADLAIPVGYTVLDKLYVVRLLKTPLSLNTHMYHSAFKRASHVPRPKHDQRASPSPDSWRAQPTIAFFPVP